VVDSSNKDEVAAADSVVTPTSKPSGKQSTDSVELLGDVFVLGSDGSATKEPKLFDSSNKDDVAAVDSVVTSTSKSLGKRSADSVESPDDIVLIDCDASVTKEPKLVRVKVEADE